MRTDVPTNDPRYLTADHVIQKTYGGRTVAGNIVAACRKCNNGRQPELNKTKRTNPRNMTIGDTTHHSPFAVLKDKT